MVIWRRKSEPEEEEKIKRTEKKKLFNDFLMEKWVKEHKGAKFRSV